MGASRAEIVACLRALGVGTGALIIVHASLRKLRPAGGAEGLLEALREALGEEGTMLMPLGAEEGEPFDPLLTPAEEDIGALAEVFRTHPGVAVSDHAAGRFGAWGPLADELLREPPLHHYYGPGSLLERFTERNGSVVRFGADLNTTTLTHYAEYLARVPNKRRVSRRYERADGRVEIITGLDDTEGIVEFEGEDYFSTMLREFFERKMARHGRLDACQVDVFEAQPHIDFAKKWLERRFS